MTLRSVNPRTGETGSPVPEAVPADVARAAGRSAAAFDAWRLAPGHARGRLLREVADRLESRRRRLIECAEFETALGHDRLAGELTRTTDQLKTLAGAAEEGSFVEAILSPEDRAAGTDGQADVRRCLMPLGPVGVFPPSNFPLAFGVAGGDTASALAAGCSVVVKGHPSHPATSELCFEACAQAVTATGAPAGLVSLVQGWRPELSRTLVLAPEIRAIAFTGSRAVGRLLYDLASTRPEPIPIYGELGSLNPVFIGEHAARDRAAELAAGLAASMLTGHGQLCTKPGLIFLPTGDAGDVVLAVLADCISRYEPAAVLNRGLRDALAGRVAASSEVPGVEELTAGELADDDGCLVSPRLFSVDLETFLARPELAEEHFGPVAIVVRGEADRIVDAAEQLDGQLAAALHAAPADEAWAGRLLPRLTRLAGRVVWNGYPTGVAVVPAMHHGGPYPATTSPLHSAVGATAIRRFMRPVAFQGVPDALLPPALQDANPLRIQRLVGGEWTRRPVVRHGPDEPRQPSPGPAGPGRGD